MYLKSLAAAAMAALAIILAVPARAEELAANWLFILDAGSMSFDGTTLTLDAVAADALAFTDRPYRLARNIPIEAFVAIWQGADFGGEPPNAGINGFVDGAAISSVVELSDPRFEGAKLVFTATLVEGDVPSAAADVSVFVDAFPTAVNDQITD